jgi:multisubunit Na+/H+ antiporter MnhG subunit
MIMNWAWTRLPPVMERTLADDLKAALFVFTGVMLGYLIFAPGDASLLLGALIGLALVIVVLNVVRGVRRRRHP